MDSILRVQDDARDLTVCHSERSSPCPMVAVGKFATNARTNGLVRELNGSGALIFYYYYFRNAVNVFVRGVF